MTALTAADLFAPAPSGVGPYGQVPAGSGAPGSWLANMLSLATLVQLPTTAWQSGGPERTIFAIEAVQFQSSDVNISVIAQGGFLQTAASGTVTTTSTSGTTVVIPVTPDPSNAAQNPTGAPGWLDLLTQSVYSVTRLAAGYATGTLSIVNLKGSTVGPYAAKAYHAANAQTGATYSSAASLSVPSGAIAGSGGNVTGVTPSGTQTVITTQSAHGLAPGQIVFVSVPTTSGYSGLSGVGTTPGVFASVIATTTSSFTIGVVTSGSLSATAPSPLGLAYTTTSATMSADAAGTGGSAAPNTVTIAVTQNTGIFVSNVSGWSGNNWESNAALAARTTLSLAAVSPNGPSQAYVYVAETAAQILAQQVPPWNSPPYTASPPYTLTNGPVLANEYANPQTGVVTTVVASTTPASTTLGQPVTPGCAQNPVTGVSNANPCVVSCTNNVGIAAGGTMSVAISGVLGTAGVNGNFTATYVSPTSFSIPLNSTAAGAYTGGGQVEGGDLGAIDNLIQTFVVPDSATAVTQSALAMPVVVLATVVVPQAYVAAYKIAVQAQLAVQLASYPIGGSSVQAPPFTVPLDDIIGALDEAGVIVLGQASYVKAIQSLSIASGATTVTAAGAGLPFPGPSYQAVLSPASVITVLGS